MNQKIIKLVRQTLNECVSTPVESVIASRIDNHGIVEIPNTFAEKFAELIVKECMDICQELVDDGLSEAETPKWKIKEHFGVEE
jgi:hypothetical protein